MEYVSILKTTDGKKVKYRYRHSYDVGSLRTVCGVSAVALGGSCWAYLAMPTTAQEDQVRSDALMELGKNWKVGTFEILGSRALRSGWGEEEAEFQLLEE